MSQRPKDFDFAMDFVGDPESEHVIEYVEQLEAIVEAAWVLVEHYFRFTLNNDQSNMAALQLFQLLAESDSKRYSELVLRATGQQK